MHERTYQNYPPPAERKDYEPDALEHTVDGYVELYADLQETQRAVSADFRSLAQSDRGFLEYWAAPHIAAMNQQRKPDDQIDITTVSDRFLVGIAEPSWKTFIPTDPSDELQTKRWNDLLDQFDEPMQDNLEALCELHTKVDILSADEKLMAEFADTRREKVALVKTATAWRRNEQQKARLISEIAARRQQASRSGRELTKREQAKLKQLQDQYDNFPEVDIDPSVSLAALQNELDRLLRRDDRQQLERGLLMTDQMQQIVDQTLPSLLRGEPLLLVGETGGAKTALAEYLVHNYFRVEPEFISAYGDVNSYQLMGKSELREQNGAPVSEFIEGPLVRAMESGRPVILDEINAMPAELLKRLNKIMQLRPGDRFTIQEDSGREVVVRQGFCIIATANEKSKRYKGVDDLSVEFQNRFGANIHRVRYPDHDTNPGTGDPAIENDRLAMAAVVNRRGEFPSTIDAGDFDNFMKACRLSQQMFAGTFDSNSQADGVSLQGEALKNRLLDGKPGLEETVLAPRTMVDILRKVAGSHGTVSIKLACANFLDGIKNPDDRAVMRIVLEHHGLLQKPVGE